MEIHFKNVVLNPGEDIKEVAKGFFEGFGFFFGTDFAAKCSQYGRVYALKCLNGAVKFCLEFFAQFKVSSVAYIFKSLAFMLQAEDSR